MAAFLLGQTEIGQDAEQEIGIKIGDVPHVRGEREIDRVALALYCSIGGSYRDHQLVDDALVRDTFVVEIIGGGFRIRFRANRRRINMRREGELSDGIRRKRRSRRLLGAVVRIQSGRNRRRKETIGIDPKDIIAGDDIRGTGEVFGDGIVLGDVERGGDTELGCFNAFGTGIKFRANRRRHSFTDDADAVTRGGDGDQVDPLIYHFVMYHLFIYLAIEQFCPPLAGIVHMIHVEHSKTGWRSVGTDALAVLERGGVRDDDGQAAFKGLLAVVVVLGGWVERSDTTADVRHFGTVNELVPDFGSARLWRAFADAFLITKHIVHRLNRLNKNIFISSSKTPQNDPKII